MSSLYQLWRFENFLDPGTTNDGYDALYVPVAGHTTGDIDIHDIHAGRRWPSDLRRHALQLPRDASPSAPASRRSGGRPSSTGSPPRTAAT